ncbi:hypothetical protein ACSBR2_038740 [Camellia fascicularis]
MDPKLTEVLQLFERLKPLLFGTISILVPNSSLSSSGRLPASPQEYPILGLNLLRLLVQNRITEFHSELELLSASAMENNCIKHAVELEQSFMEGLTTVS